MRRQIAFIYAFIFIATVIFLLFRGYRMGRKEIDLEIKKEISGKILKIFIPTDEKIIHIIFSNGTEYAPSFFGLNNIVEVGDSICKPFNSLKFKIYKKGIIQDSISYEATNRFYK